MNPNARQVGGDHYRAKNPLYQHWDIVADFNMNYYTGAATKYVARWREKDGLRDLEKAPHYIDKLISLYDGRRGPYCWEKHTAVVPDNRLYRWCAEQGLTTDETLIVELAVNYANRDDLLRLRARLIDLAHSFTPTQTKGGASS